MVIRDREGKIWNPRCGRMGWIKAAALALLIVLALPAGAASDRAVKSKVPPVYPELAKRMKISGVVKVEATVDGDGKVDSRQLKRARSSGRGRRSRRAPTHGSQRSAGLRKSPDIVALGDPDLDLKSGRGSPSPFRAVALLELLA